jgi:carboxymethylenebutenolidase
MAFRCNYLAANIWREIVGEMITVRMEGNREMGAYLAVPKSGKGPGLLLGMAIVGVNFELRANADHFADLGYVVLAPNVFWRLDPTHEVDFSDKAMDRGLQLLDQFSDDQGVADLGVAAQMLRSLPQCTGKVGSVGWCMGGRLAYLCAAAKTVDCAACFYPTWIETRLDLADTIDRPLSLHMPEDEPFAKIDNALEKVTETFQGRSNVEFFVYPGASHGFDFPDPQPFNRRASRLANARIALFLERNLSRQN